MRAAAALATHGVDWRPLMGVAPHMVGGLVDRVLAWEIGFQVAAHNNRPAK